LYGINVALVLFVKCLMLVLLKFGVLKEKKELGFWKRLYLELECGFVLGMLGYLFIYLFIIIIIIIIIMLVR
jgi:hypothetical protein